jgi:hypothetical protein
VSGCWSTAIEDQDGAKAAAAARRLVGRGTLGATALLDALAAAG